MTAPVPEATTAPETAAAPKPLVQRLLVNAIVAVASLSLVLGFDPFGWGGATDQRAEQVIQGIFAPFYDSTDSARHVTVVLIDAEYFAAGAKPVVWPLPVNDLVYRVLQPIVELEPRAIFIDLSFPDAPREIIAGGNTSTKAAATALGTALAETARQGVPIFIADGLTPDAAVAPAAGADCPVDYVAEADVLQRNILSDDFLEAAFPPAADGAVSGLAPGLAIVNAAWSGGTRRYPLAPVMIGPRHGCGKRAEAGTGFMLSPALALYAEYYRGTCLPASGRSQPGCADPALFNAIKADPVRDGTAGNYRTHALGAAAREALAINWGHYVSTDFKQAFGDKANSDFCFDQFDPSARSRVRRAFGSFWTLLSNGGRLPIRRCVYIDTISAGHLMKAPDGAAIDTRFLKDRLVIIGVSLPQAKDNFLSPINGQIPGAYIHAAALENLIHYGPDFKTDAIPTGEWLLKLLIIMLVATLFPEAWAPLRRLADRLFKPALIALAVTTLVFSGLAIFVSFGLYLLSDRLTNMPLGVLAVPMIAMFAQIFTSTIASLRLDVGRALDTIAAWWRTRLGRGTP